MLQFSESYIYNSIMDKEKSHTKKIRDIALSGVARHLVSAELSKQISDMVRFYKTPDTIRIQRLISEGDIQLVCLPDDLRLPAAIPFVCYKVQGQKKVFVDVARYISTHTIGDRVEYSIDIKKLYALTYGAYVAYSMEKTHILSSDAAKWSAYLWARMFCKILNNAIGLTLDQERYDAFMYYAMKFCCIHYLELPIPMCNQIAEGMTPHFSSNYVIRNMENVINERQYPVFDSIAEFCKTLFTDEVGGLKGIKIANVKDRMSISEYFKKFMTAYGPVSVMALSSYPYFIFVMYSAYLQAMIVNDRMLKDIVKDDEKKAMVKLLNALEKELE